MTPKEQDQFIKSVIITCPDGKEYNSNTKRCNKKCKPGFTRDDKFKCKKQTAKRKKVPPLQPGTANRSRSYRDMPALEPGTANRSRSYRDMPELEQGSDNWSRSSRDVPPRPRSKSAKKCLPGKELNPKTNRCNKTCKQGYTRNAQFKCIKIK